jgi:hypothetical protein
MEGLMQPRLTVISTGHSTADSFSHQIVLSVIGPIVAALLGGLVVTLICQRIQNHRAELRQEEDRKRAERERRAQISLDIMRIAFGFYTRLIEITRVEQYEGTVSLGSLPRHYQAFRVDARVLEEQLRYTSQAAKRGGCGTERLTCSASATITLPIREPGWMT